MDLIDFSGPAFKTVDNRVAALRLVQKELCDAALFDPTGTFLIYSERPAEIFIIDSVVALSQGHCFPRMNARLC